MKKLLSIILAVALLMAVMPIGLFNVSAISKIFPDTANDAWYSDAVRYVADSGIMKGYADGTFGTADGIQRQDFLVMLARYAGVNLEDYANIHGQFPDVGESTYYEAAVNWGYEKGIVTGYQNGYFGVSDLINREQIVTFLYRYAKYKSLNVNISYSAAEPLVIQYTDFRNVSDYAQKPVLWAINRGVISGKNPTTISPEGTAQRCEIAQIMYNIYKNDIFDPDKVFEGSDSDFGDIPLLPEIPIVPPTNPYDEIASASNVDLIAERVLYYINQYRSTPATKLPGLTRLAKYRSTQLVSNYGHIDMDMVMAQTACKYGEPYEVDGEIFYASTAREAIGYTTIGVSSVDEMARRIATTCKNSSGHWSYVGSYAYIGVGCSYGNGRIYTCIDMDEQGIYG